ncbi:MAG TPA: NAD-dependent deacylase [Sphingomicrobium sp.]|nr:NAD-dependent deacylase [Sphingomicrobium sp.]
MENVRNIVILTGAGVSAESGLATFRGPDGLWEGHRVEDVATPEAYARDPALVHQFYDARRARLHEVEPNAAHVALARLDAEWPGRLLIVTQNVDDLHERAGAKRLLHMHGDLTSGWCLACDERFSWEGPMSPFTDCLEPGAGLPLSADSHQEGQSFDKLRTNGNVCPVCSTPGQVRPDIVWFGEMPYEMDRIDAALMACDLFVSIGTSGAVYPAAGFVQTARYCGAKTLEINLEPSQGSIFFDERRYGPAGVEVPKWVHEILAQSAQSSPMSL